MARHLDNPAGRLHALLTDLSEVSPADRTQTRAAWASVLDIEEGDLAGLTRGLGYVLNMPEQVKAQINDIQDVDHDLMLRHMHKVEAALSRSILSLNEAVAHVHAQYNEATLLSLELCSDALHRRRAERVVADDDLKRIDEEISKLVDEVRSSKLDQDLRDFLLTHLAEMHQAVGDVRIRGSIALEEVLDRTCGAISRKGDLRSRIDQQEPVWTMFASLMSIIASAMQVTALVLMPAPATNPPTDQLKPMSTIQIEAEQIASASPPVLPKG